MQQRHVCQPRLGLTCRQQGNKDRVTNGNGIMSTGGAEAKSFEGLMSSPWKVGLKNIVIKRQAHISLAGWNSLAGLQLPAYMTLVAAAPSCLAGQSKVRLPLCHSAEAALQLYCATT